VAWYGPRDPRRGRTCQCLLSGWLKPNRSRLGASLPVAGVCFHLFFGFRLMIRVSHMFVRKRVDDLGDDCGAKF
jgi:hypothetical protein